MFDPRRTQEIEVTEAMLAAVFPREMLHRRVDDEPTPHAELASDRAFVALVREHDCRETMELPVVTL